MRAKHTIDGLDDAIVLNNDMTTLDADLTNALREQETELKTKLPPGEVAGLEALMSGPSLSKAELLSDNLGESPLAVAVLDLATLLLRRKGDEYNWPRSFAAARTKERKFKLLPSPEAEIQRYRHWCAWDLVPQKSFLTYLASLAKLKLAHLPWVELVAAWAESTTRFPKVVGPVDDKVLDGIVKVATAHKKLARVTECFAKVLPTLDLSCTPLSALAPHANHVSAVISGDSRVLEWSTQAFPKLRYDESAKVWLDVLAEAGVPNVWAKSPRGNDAALWVTRLSDWLEQQSYLVPECVAWLYAHADQLREPLTGKAIDLRADVDLELLDVFLALGCTLKSREGEWRLHRSPWWERTNADLQLPRVRADEVLSKAFAKALELYFSTRGFKKFSNPLSRHLPEFWNEAVARGVREVEAMSLADFSDGAPDLKRAIEAHASQPNPVLLQVLAQVSLEKMLQNTLRRGILDELGWPEKDRLLAQDPGLALGGWSGDTFPFLKLKSKDADEESFLSPDGVVPKPAKAAIIPTKTKSTDAGTIFHTAYSLPGSYPDSPFPRQGNAIESRLTRRDAEWLVLESCDGTRVEWRAVGTNVTYVAKPVMKFRFAPRDADWLVVKNSDTWSFVDQQCRGAITETAFWGDLAKWWTDGELPYAFWNFLVPRDPKGSKALAACSVEQAARLLELARADKTDAAELRQVLPEVTSQELLRGIAHVLKQALGCEKTWREFTKSLVLDGADATVQAPILEPAPAPPAQPPPASPASPKLADADAPILEELFGNNRRFSREKGGDLKASLLDAERFFQAQDVANGLLALTQTRLCWAFLQAHSAFVAHQLLSPMTSDEHKQQCAAVLKFWASTQIAAAPQDYRVFEVVFPTGISGAKSNQYVAGFAENGRRYVLFQNTSEWASYRQQYIALEKKADGGFRDPEGSSVLWIREGAETCLSTAQIHEVLRLHAAKTTVPLSKGLTQRFSERTGLTQAAAALLLSGQFWREELDKALLKALGIKRDEENLARVELHQKFKQDQSLDLDGWVTWPELWSLSDCVLPLDDESKLLDRYCESFTRLSCPRKRIDAALLAELEADLSRDHRFYYDLRMLEQPGHFPSFTRDGRWLLRPYYSFSERSWEDNHVPPGWPKLPSQGDETEFPDRRLAFSGRHLQRFMQLMSWAYLEVPRDSDFWLGLRKQASLIAERLQNPDLILLAGAVSLRKTAEQDRPGAFAKLVAPVAANSADYVASDAGPAALGKDRGDLVVTWPKEQDGAFFCFRPARYQNLEQLETLAHELGFYEMFRKRPSFCGCGLNLGNSPTHDIADLPHFLFWRSAGAQQLVQDLAKSGPDLTPAPKGYWSDPRVSAPELVSEVGQSLKLDERAATVFLQLLALPDPSPGKLQKYNGWSAKAYAEVEAQLRALPVLHQRKVTRTKRTLFFKDSIAAPVPPAVPLEHFKVELYDLELDTKKRPIASYKRILPHKPLSQLFEAAWRLAQERFLG